MCRSGGEEKLLSYYPLKVFHYNGLHPKDFSKRSKLLFAVNLLGFAMLVALGVLGMLKSYSSDLPFMVECLQTCILMLHCVGKQIAIMTNKSSLSYLVDNSLKFWDLSDFESEVAEKYGKMMTFADKIIKASLLLGIVICCFFYVQPFVTGALPSLCYEPQGWHLFLILLFWYLSYFIYGAILGLNTFFYSVCLPVVVQFKLLRHKFKEIEFNSGECEKGDGEERLWGEMKRFVDYHNFLLEYCKKINEMANPVFLLECCISVVASCLQLFIIMNDEFPLGNKLKCVVYFIGEITGTAIYCFSTELVSNASAEVADAMYNSNWYETSIPGVRKAINMVIRRSQKVVTFSGHGFIVINLATFTVIFKTILSFYTYLKTIEERKSQH